MDDDLDDQDLMVLDMTILLESFGAFNEDLRNTLRLFQKTMVSRLATIGQKLNEGKQAEAAEEAHAAKGVSNTIGALRLGYCCGEIERALRRGDQATARQELLALTAAYAEVDSEICIVLAR